MYRKSDTDSQMTIFSKESEWTDYQTKRIKNGWPEFFRKNILPNIDEDSYKVLYSDKKSRPNTPVNIMVSLEIIKTLLGVSDDEMLDQVLFNQKVQYAIGTLDAKEQPISKNVMSNFRVRIYNYQAETGINLFDNTMKKINEIIIKMSSISRGTKRIDSMMVSDSCKSMSRMELIYKINERFIEKLYELGEKVSGYFRQYLEEGNSVEVLYKTRENETGGKIKMLLNDSIKLHTKYKHNKRVNETKEFKQLERLIEEQYDKDKKEPKDGHDIKPTSLQTPHDEDSTYRYKYGANKGYVGNIVEIVDTAKDLNLIEKWDVDKNIKSDKEFMEDYIEEKKKDASEELAIVDAAYFSKELNQKAKEVNIKLHPTDLTGKNDKDKITNLSEFEINELIYNKNNNLPKINDVVEKCQNGYEPKESYLNVNTERVHAKFEKEKCNNCPFKKECVVKFQQNVNKLNASIGEIEYQRTRREMLTEEYKNTSKIRAGIEGIPSLMRNVYKIDKRTTKGIVYLKMKFGEAILSINIKRMVKYQNKQAQMA